MSVKNLTDKTLQIIDGVKFLTSHKYIYGKELLAKNYKGNSNG